MLNPRELGPDTRLISLGSITNGSWRITQENWVRIRDPLALGPLPMGPDPRHAVLKTRSLGSAARHASLALAPGTCSPSARCSQHGAQPHLPQLLELFVSGHDDPNTNTRCPQHRACCPIKICIGRFFLNYSFNIKCIPIKRQSHYPHAIFVAFYDKNSFVITLL